MTRQPPTALLTLVCLIFAFGAAHAGQVPLPGGVDLRLAKQAITQRLYAPVPVQTQAPRRDNYKHHAILAAKANNLPPAMLLAQIKQESGFNPRAVSRAGALGIGQIMPKTAKSWHVNPMQPKASINAMARAMRSYWMTYRRQGHDSRTAYRMALAAYNAGPGAVHKYKGVPPYQETRHYVSRIITHWPNRS